MINSARQKDKLAKMEIIFAKYNFLGNELGNARNIGGEIDNFAFRVVIIGGFSSGKSALINYLAGRDLLKEDQGPETSTPAEIFWASVESAAIAYSDGKIERRNIAGITENPPGWR